MTYEELKHQFGFHPATSSLTRETHESVRDACLSTAEELRLLVPPGREQSLAITKLEEAMFWANAGIARAGAES